MRTGLVLVAYLLAGCGHDLTRDTAKRLLDRAAAEAVTSEISISQPMAAKLTAIGNAQYRDVAGLFVLSDGDKVQMCVPAAGVDDLMLHGLVSCPYRDPDITPQQPDLVLKLKTPLRLLVVAVTDISTDPENQRTVDYTWHLDFSPFHLPSEVERCLDQVRSATASFSYDGSWHCMKFGIASID